MTTIHDLPEEEARRIVSHIRRLVPRMSHTDMISFILAISLENARLAQEINIHRAARGIEPMKIYIPGSNGK